MEAELRALIRQMSTENQLWEAMRLMSMSPAFSATTSETRAILPTFNADLGVGAG
jgi:hypothetical protein